MDSKTELDPSGWQVQDVIEFYGIPIPERPEPALPFQAPEIEAMPNIDEYVLSVTTMKIQEVLEANGWGNLPIQPPKDKEVRKQLDQEGKSVDLSIPVFAVIKKDGEDAAAALAKEITDKVELVSDVFITGPFLNIELKSDEISHAIIASVEEHGEHYGELNIGNGEMIVIDCSSPNIAKSMTVAHLRSTAIGESLNRIYRAVGYNSIRDNHLGDWGTQFGMLGRAVELWGGEYDDLLKSDDSNKVVEGLLKLYVRMHDEMETEKNKIVSDSNGETTLEDVSDDDTSLGQEGRAWFHRLENGDPEALELWKWASQMSLAEFKKIYDQLDVDFEYWLGEGYYIPFCAPTVDALMDSGVAGLDELGRTVVHHPKEKKLDKLAIRKSDGTTLYGTRDMAALAARTAWFDPERIVYVVDYTQNPYFESLFETYREFLKQYDVEAPNMTHVKFGLMNLPEGKMSSRKGNVVFLSDVLDEAVKRAKDKMLENFGDDIPEGLDIDDTAKKVGVGAVIFSDLGGPKDRKITFEWEKVLSLEGYSGPFIQYANARINSLNRRIEEENIPIDSRAPLIDIDDKERELIMLVGQYPEAVLKAAERDEPSVISEHLYKIANTFNGMYRQKQFLNEPDIALRSSRMRIARAAQQVLTSGAKLLNLPLPDRM